MKRILLPVAFAAIALAGCSSEEPASTAAPGDSALQSVPPVVAESSAAAPSSAAPSSAAPAGSGAASPGLGCPVDAATLKKAFQDNAEVAGAVILGKGFKDISCYQGWATALTQPEQMDTAVVVFKYNATKKTWVAVMGGTDNVCGANAPAEIQPHLKNC